VVVVELCVPALKVAVLREGLELKVRAGKALFVDERTVVAVGLGEFADEASEVCDFCLEGAAAAVEF
jgi:hypothetical protein